MVTPTQHHSQILMLNVKIVITSLGKSTYHSADCQPVVKVERAHDQFSLKQPCTNKQSAQCGHGQDDPEDYGTFVGVQIFLGVTRSGRHFAASAVRIQQDRFETGNLQRLSLATHATNSQTMAQEEESFGVDWVRVAIRAYESRTNASSES